MLEERQDATVGTEKLETGGIQYIKQTPGMKQNPNAGVKENPNAGVHWNY